MIVSAPDVRRCPECGVEIHARPGKLEQCAGGSMPARIYECPTKAQDGKSHWTSTERAVPNGPAR